MAVTILVADDDPTLVELLATVLEDAGYAVLRAYDGAQARALLERARPALVIADIAMPELSGPDLAAWVRAGEGAGARLPIVLISGDSRRPDGAAAPATVFLAKPFTVAQVEALVAALVPPPPASEGRPAAGPPALRGGGG